jgi:two-component system OmpR family response regulator
MKEIIDWLQHMEQLACEVYNAISDCFSQDEEFYSFLSRLAEEESLHFHIMGSAAQYLQEAEKNPVSAVRIDSTTKDRIETPLKQLYGLAKDNSISKQEVVDYIVKTEFSEWNDIFLYVINTLRGHSRTFQYGAAVMQEHQKGIERFLEYLPADLSATEDVRKLPRIWKERILIVEDDPPVRDVLARFLGGNLGSVEKASNGQEALEKIKDHFFNAVVSDIEMPVMGGLELYRAATQIAPEIATRFLFCTGKTTAEVDALCREKGLLCLEKPFRLHRLGEAVRAIMDKAF